MLGMGKSISHLYATVIFKEKELKNQLIAYSNRFLAVIFFLGELVKLIACLTKCWL